MNRVYPPVRGATGRVLRDLAVSFAREGWHVTVISSGPEGGDDRIDGVRILRVKGAEKPKYFMSYIWVWIKMYVLALRLKSRHLVVTMSDPPLVIFAGHLLCRIKKSRHINWCQDLYPEVLPALGLRLPAFIFRLFQRIRRNSMHACDKVIVPGRCMAKYLADDGMDARRIAVVTNWPDWELTDPEMMDERGVPYRDIDTKKVRPFEQQKKVDARFRILYSGNLGLVHPIESVLSAAAILMEKEGNDIEFVFVGDGPQFDYIAQQRSERGLSNIRLLPHQPVSNLRTMLESGDVHLITMKEDAAGFVVPSKLYAALAVARPSIFVGPHQSEVAKIMSDFEAGLVVAPDDAESLVDAILYYRENGDAWFSAHSGAVRAREVFTPYESIDAWMERAWAVIQDDLGAC